MHDRKNPRGGVKQPSGIFVFGGAEVKKIVEIN